MGPAVLSEIWFCFAAGKLQDPVYFGFDLWQNCSYTWYITGKPIVSSFYHKPNGFK